MADPLDTLAEHAALIGSVVIAYNRVQWLVSVLFVAFSGMPMTIATDHWGMEASSPWKPAPSRGSSRHKLYPSQFGFAAAHDTSGGL